MRRKRPSASFIRARRCSPDLDLLAGQQVLPLPPQAIGRSLLTRWALGDEPSLHVVFESGHPNAGDAVRIYENARARFPPNDTRALNGLSFATKQECLPLAAADLFAYFAYGEEMNAKPLGTPTRQPKTDKGYGNNLYRVEITPEVLEALYQASLRQPP
ncbi:hypothetical protein SAMN05519103_01918 [Rhizobiales bacterium GAS113]|nr:hypothetical protein SAMN05519103_01918 [Rhizobiales bacterium GAS113]